MSVDHEKFNEFFACFELGRKDLDEIKDDIILQIADSAPNVQIDEYELKGALPYPDRNGRGYDDPDYREEYNNWKDHNKKLMSEVLERFGYKHLEQDGGGEGGTEACYGVFEFCGKIYEASWRYYSHHGYEYDGIYSSLREVKPVEKTITVYEGV